MRIIKPYVLIEEDFDPIKFMKVVEKRARLCYKSEDKITEDSYKTMMNTLVSRKHWPMFDHATIAVKFVVDRGVSHEIVRHRIGVAYAQESTRYCNYSKDKFGGEVTFILPFAFEEDHRAYDRWYNACSVSETMYNLLTGDSVPAQWARSVLNNSLKTEIWVTGDITFWRHFFSLRAVETAHPQMQQVVIPLLHHFQTFLPLIFGDMDYNRNFSWENYGAILESEEDERIYLNQ